MVKIDELLAAEIGSAIRAYRAETCPNCESPKHKRADAFCFPCLLLLPESFREALADRTRFIELFHPAMAHLRNHSAAVN